MDPWQVAARLRGCAASWEVSLRLTGAGLSCLPRPNTCNLGHVCPLCAADHSAALAESLRAVLAELDRRPVALPAGAGEQVELVPRETAAAIALVTFTHRAAGPGTPLAAELHLQRRAWQLMTTGRPGRALRSMVDGWYYGDEAPRSWPGKADGKARPDAESAEYWHAHRHAVLRLRPGVEHATLRAHLAEAWRTASAAAAAELGREGDGWDPAAGGCAVNADGEITDPSGGWYVAVDPSRPAEVYQAAKYPTPVADLRPVAMAEFLAVGHLRRWHQGAGSLRSVVRLAKELQAAGWTDSLDGDVGDEPIPLDLGRNVAMMVPGQCPRLDEVAPNLGVAGKSPELPRPGWFSRWRIVPSEVDAVRDALRAVRGAYAVETDDGSVWVSVPRDWAHARTVELAGALTAAVRQRERRRKPGGALTR